MAYLFEMSIFFFRWFLLNNGLAVLVWLQNSEMTPLAVCESTDVVTVDRL